LGGGGAPPDVDAGEHLRHPGARAARTRAAGRRHVLRPDARRRATAREVARLPGRRTALRDARRRDRARTHRGRAVHRGGGRGRAPIAASRSPRRSALATEPPPLGVFLRYFLRLGALGFGGPIALAGYMQRDLVEQRRWIAPQDYVEGLALAQLAPGPLAAQLAIYLGWVRGGATGATLVGVAFVLPSFVMVLAISALY